MQKLLVPIDGSPGSERAVRHALKLAGMACPLDIHLLHVQLPVSGWEVKRFLRDAEIEAIQSALTEEATQSARSILDTANLHYTLHSAVGEVAQTIAAYAKQFGIDQIIMGTRGMGSLEGLLLGSIATKVLHLVEVPVTLVK
jgi:nucleotide-binding universal stress UspA family protein